MKIVMLAVMLASSAVVYGGSERYQVLDMKGSSESKDPEKPLSDQELCKCITKNGFLGGKEIEGYIGSADTISWPEVVCKIRKLRNQEIPQSVWWGLMLASGLNAIQSFKSVHEAKHNEGALFSTGLCIANTLLVPGIYGAQLYVNHRSAYLDRVIATIEANRKELQ